MSGHEKFERIEPIGETEGSKKLAPSDMSGAEDPSKAKFEAALEKADPSRVEVRRSIASVENSTIEAKKASLLDLATQATSEGSKVTPTPKSLSEQAGHLQSQLRRPRAVLLESGTLPLDAKTVTTLSGHIEHVERSLREASKIATGVEVGGKVPTEQSPGVRFLSYVTESEKHLSNMVAEIEAMELSKDKLTPAKLLAIQVKLGFVQQELEFFTTVLNKALESTKTIMNVQI